MIIATSNDDKCIKNLMYLLEKTYPGISFELSINKTCRIEIPDKEVAVWNDMNKGIFKSMGIFCDGYTVGWESAVDAE